MIDRVVSALLSLVVLVATVFFVLQSCGVGAQPPVPDALLLDALRVRISEADFRPECERFHRDRPRGCVTDGAAIIERHFDAAERRGTTLGQELRAYSRRATGQRPARSPRGAWVAALTLDLRTAPPGWPEHIPWASRTEAIEQIEGRMRDLLSAALTGPPYRVCDEPVDHWGGVDGCEGGPRRGACDRVPSCWRRIPCGPTVNAFYAVECPRPASMSRRRPNPTLPASIARGDHR